MVWEKNSPVIVMLVNIENQVSLYISNVIIYKQLND